MADSEDTSDEEDMHGSQLHITFATEIKMESTLTSFLQVDRGSFQMTKIKGSMTLKRHIYHFVL